jgi:Zn-dependent protease with chaperone function
MLFDLRLPGLALAVLCLVPAAFRWWSGRTLSQRLDDPLLPERLLAHARRNLTVLWTVIVFTILLGRYQDLFWSLPLMLVARTAAAYPLRRALFDESWSLVSYVMTMVRLFVAVGGFWILLATTPVLANIAGSFDWIVALALGALLFVWNDRAADVFRWLARAQPLSDEALLARFKAIAAASQAAQPRFELIDLRGGAIANAVALGSLRGSSVLYTDTLLRLLDADESTAITAHEIAHLEYYDTERLQRLWRITSGLIVAALCASMLPRLIPGVSLLLLTAGWFMGLVMTLAWIARDRQRNETASDLRGLELCGNPDALIQALTKIHVFARVPRRWDTQMEAMASHPSLARRIRAIRDAAGAAHAPANPEPETVRGADGRIAITFEVDRLNWQESEGVTHVLSYAHLMELRVHARTVGATRLVAVERGGRRWEVALDASEAARAQAILDRVDVHLSAPVAQSHTTPLLHIASAIVAICAMWAGQIVVAIVALVASVRPTPVSFAAVGGAALAGVALIGRDALAAGRLNSAWQPLLLLAIGVGLVAGAWWKRETDESRASKLGIAALAGLTALSLILIATRSWTAVGLYQASVAFPAATIFPFALAAAMACQSRRVWRRAVVPVAAVGLLVGIAGSGTFLHAFGRDPFLVSGRRLTIEPLTGSPIADFTIPMSVADLRLSPSGARIAVLTTRAPMSIATTFAVGTPGAELTPIPANDVLFLDDERVLTLTADGEDTIVREVRVETRTTEWEHRIQNLTAGRLAYRRESKRWMVTGNSFDAQLVSVEALLGGSEVKRREWNTAEQSAWADAWALEGDTVVLARKDFDLDMLHGNIMSSTLSMLLSQIPTRLTRIGPTGTIDIATSQLDTTCSDRAFDAARLVCLAFDGTRTHLVVLEPRDSTPRPVGSIGGRFMSYRPAAGGWVSGWLHDDWLTTTQLAIDLQSGRAISLPREFSANELTVWGHVAATLTHLGTSTRVRLYRLDAGGDRVAAAK